MSDSEEREIRAILADLQEEIRRHRLALGDLGAAPRPDPLTRVRECQTVNPHLPIGWPVMPRGLLPKLGAYAQKITRRLLRWYINPIVAQQNAFNAAAVDTLATLQARIDELAQQWQALDQAQVPAGLQRQLRAIVDDRQMQMHQRFEDELEATRLRLQRLENWHKGIATRALSTAPHDEPTASIDYFLLGALYRNPHQMADRLGDYDDLFGGLAANQPPALPVLDIGCGRGEFVAHLVSLGLPAYGIDLDADALAIGREQGLDLRPIDAFTHLRGLADNSLAAVTLIQVVEHFEPEALLRLLQLIAQKLVTGGLLIAETINPACLYALANWYLMDPSHRVPVHSETLRFLLAQAGFHRSEVRFLHPVPDVDRLQDVIAAQQAPDSACAALAARIQHNIDRLNHFLYGPQDYAVVAYKLEV